MATATPTSAHTSTDNQHHNHDRRSLFERIIGDQPPILESLIAQLPTESILSLSHTSPYLRTFLRNSPTSWRYISMRLPQPAVQVSTPTANGPSNGPRQSSNYALDQLLLYVINPFSTRLVSLELDNTAVSGATLFQTVMVLRKDTLEHVSVRGCKNVSLKYHINPWLMMHAMAMERSVDQRAPGYEKLALKSLYTYRCRHHRRRPYLPSSLTRKESDSEPTHELVLTCHKLGIWTDTAWCTTPGARCFRRRGYVTMRVPQDPREVWVVFDRLWRSRNWLGPVPDSRAASPAHNKKRRRDPRSWEFDEDAIKGESVGIKGEGKDTPAHLRRTHKQFVDEIYCDNCSDLISERCEQCSVMMHCSGCRKTLCASCAFDRPYLRNKNAPSDERNKFWWAPGCAVSPCSMQDTDIPVPGHVHNQPGSVLPSIKFRWCCTEPVFSGGGGITFNPGSTRDTDRIRAVPLRMGEGWEDPEFSHGDEHATHICKDRHNHMGAPLSRADALHGPGGRWPSIDNLFQQNCSAFDQNPPNVPRILCDECHSSEQWKIKCKACSVALCLKHDVKDRMKVRICGYKDLTVEKVEFRSRQKALKLLAVMMVRRRINKGKQKSVAAVKNPAAAEEEEVEQIPAVVRFEKDVEADSESGLQTPRPIRDIPQGDALSPEEIGQLLNLTRTTMGDTEPPARPVSPSSNSSAPLSRSSSPTPSQHSLSATPEPNSVPRRPERPTSNHPLWRGCQSFFCPSSRTPGDHRRRCVALMRQCAECKIHVCEQCTLGLEAPCPCVGCRITTGDPTQAGSSVEETLRFFCPNCRWTRMKNGKCKKRQPSHNGKSRGKKARKSRPKKPIEERQSHQTSHGTHTEPDLFGDDAEGLASFFAEVDLDDDNMTENRQAEDSIDSLEDLIGVNGQPEDIRQLEDMGALARDLISRIQQLRQQFGPGSRAALALPNITMQDLRAEGLVLIDPAHTLDQIDDVNEAEVLEPAQNDENEMIQPLEHDELHDSSSGDGL